MPSGGRQTLLAGSRRKGPWLLLSRSISPAGQHLVFQEKNLGGV